MLRFANNQKPWVVTSEYELMQDAMKRREYVKEYLEQSPFPGLPSTVEDKVKWLKAIEAQYQEILEEEFYMTSAPESGDVVKEILFENAPDEIRLDVTIKAQELDEVAAAMKDEEKMKFVESFPKFNYNSGKEDDGSSSLNTFEACIQWLKKNAIPSPASMYSGHVVLVSFMSSKDCDLSEKVVETLQNIGIGKPYLLKLCVSPLEMGLHFWSPNDKVGENMYTAISSDNRSGLKYTITVGTKIPKDSPVATAERAFKELLNEKKRGSVERGNPKVSMLVERKDAPKPDSEDEEGNPETNQFYEPLWLPECYKTYYRQIYNHFMAGEGESSDIKMRLEKGNTDTGNIKEMLFQRQLAYVKKIRSTQEKFAATLALTMVISYDGYWMMDNECPDEVKKGIRNLATLWRNNLLALDDSALGIGIEDGTDEPLDDKGLSHSRSLLYNLMTTLAKNIGSMESVGRFNWKPAASKKRKVT